MFHLRNYDFNTSCNRSIDDQVVIDFFWVKLIGLLNSINESIFLYINYELVFGELVTLIYIHRSINVCMRTLYIHIYFNLFSS
jgi:hypothetical protein